MIEIMYNILWIFFIYGFLGWCMEVVYATTNFGKFINRGFLTGPICPIYGFGVVLVVIILYSIKDNVVILFFGAMVLASILEFITGFILEKLFNEKWWDYSNMPFNVKGYICLKFSIAWGLICVFIIKIIYPFTDKFINVLPKTLGTILLMIFSITIITDFIITLISVLNLPKRIKTLIDVENRLNELSKNIGKELSEGTINIQEKKNEVENRIKEESLKLEELKKKYARLMNEGNFVHKRLWKAFPNIRNGKYKDIVNKIMTNKNKKE